MSQRTLRGTFLKKLEHQVLEVVWLLKLDVE